MQFSKNVPCWYRSIHASNHDSVAWTCLETTSDNWSFALLELGLNSEQGQEGGTWFPFSFWSHFSFSFFWYPCFFFFPNIICPSHPDWPWYIKERSSKEMKRKVWTCVAVCKCHCINFYYLYLWICLISNTTSQTVYNSVEGRYFHCILLPPLQVSCPAEGVQCMFAKWMSEWAHQVGKNFPLVPLP